jgi:hypothetical protein
MKRHALLIGVPRYHDARITPLRYAAADARALGQALRAKCAFDHVTVLAGEGTAGEPTVAAILDALDAMAHQVQVGDLFFFGFSGHGAELLDRKEGVLYAADTRALHPAANSLSLNTLRDLLARLKARWLVLLVDACRDHPVAGKGAGDYRLGAEFAKNMVGVAQAGGGKARATAFLSACQPGQRAHEWPAFGHGVCSHYLLEGLNGPAWSHGRLTIRDLAKHAEGQLAGWSQSSGLAQQPWFEQFGTGDIVLGEDPPFAPVPEPPAPERPGRRARPGVLAAVAVAVMVAGLLWTFRGRPPGAVPAGPTPAPGATVAHPPAGAPVTIPASADSAGEERQRRARDTAVERLDRFAELTNAVAMRELEAYVEGVTATLPPAHATNVQQALASLRQRIALRAQADRLAGALRELGTLTNGLNRSQLLEPGQPARVDQTAATHQGTFGEQTATALANLERLGSELKTARSRAEAAAAEQALRQRRQSAGTAFREAAAKGRHAALFPVTELGTTQDLAAVEDALKRLLADPKCLWKQVNVGRPDATTRYVLLGSRGLAADEAVLQFVEVRPGETQVRWQLRLFEAYEGNIGVPLSPQTFVNRPDYAREKVAEANARFRADLERQLGQPLTLLPP